MSVLFFCEDTSHSLKDHPLIISWIKKVAEQSDHEIISLNYIFCSDDYLLKINTEYLNHSYLTDVITFDNSEKGAKIEGDIFISTDRVEENAKSYHLDFQQELHRVIIHGLLHLLGFNDKTETERKQMREKEDACLSLLKTKSFT